METTHGGGVEQQTDTQPDSILTADESIGKLKVFGGVFGGVFGLDDQNGLCNAHDQHEGKH